ncbi:flagellar motor protein MotB [Rahnella sp. SAP-1]|uniref:Flagellar motor protein MotB n=1 Tax=Rouxiella aceris TaxID=2703884 RepID=A0A848MJY6_9GAMM|nr:flagellar motor protein MotB [Rouxiella aceris]NMP28015.1 flagellar motor protein MotB [Rouxiella aceris]
MKHQSHPIIVVRKKKHGHGGHHGGSWKIAYADFMTAMMAFFLVMWLIAISNPKQLVQIAEYFRTPLAVAINPGKHTSDATNPIPGGGADPTMKEGEIHKAIAAEGEVKESRELQRLKDQLEQMLASDPRLRALRPHLMINLTEQGLRIQIIDSKNRPMFQLGSANVEPYMRDILRAIAPILDAFPNKISLAGHTDDMPYATGERGYSNWELSTDRANASRREMTSGGLSDGKVIRVMGMGSTMMLKDHPTDDAINRRISILVLNKSAQEAIERENSEGESLIINDAGELKKMAPTGSSNTNSTTNDTGKTAAPVKGSTDLPSGSVVQNRLPPQQATNEPVKPATPVAAKPAAPGADKATTAPAGAAVTVTPTSSTSRDSQQR